MQPNVLTSVKEIDLSVLEDTLLFNVLVVAGVFGVCLDPTDVFTPSVPPFLQTLQARIKRINLLFT